MLLESKQKRLPFLVLVELIISTIKCKKEIDVLEEIFHQVNSFSMAEIVAKRPRKCLNDEKTKKNLVCTVCGGDATGFNFSVITCMCCKAFFRRNALYGLEPFQCRYSSENCLINIESRRDCSFCRLKKCFQVGMKKELILTEEMKRLKREKIVQNRQMTVISSRPTVLGLSPQGTKQNSFDMTLINNINNAYEEYCRNPIRIFEQQQNNCLNQQPIKARMKLQHYFEYFQIHQNSLINFFTKIPEFEQFSSVEQRVLGTQNILLLMRVSLVETIQDQLPIWSAIHLLLESIFGKNLLDETENLIHQLKFDVNDSICIRLVLLIFLFSTCNNYQGHVDTLIIYRIQEKFIDLFSSYVKNRYGSWIACRKISSIVRHCLHLQTIGNLAEEKKRQINLQTTIETLE